jgi:RNA polymerase sigma-32 factor
MGLRAAARRRRSDLLLLSLDEERDLAALSQSGDPRAVDKLVRAHLRYVEKIARKYRRYGVPMSDLVQEGTIGLIHAIRRFDPSKGSRLATYASWWVRSAIQEHVVKSWSMVRVGTSTAQKAMFFRLRRMMADLRDGADSLTEDLVRPIAKRFNIPLKEAMNLAGRAGRSDPSLNQHLRDDSEQEWIDHLPDSGETPEEAVAAESEARFCKKAIAAALARLPDRERVIIAGRYLSDLKKTRSTIGGELGLSKERVRQLEQAALEKLRKFLGPKLNRAAAR